MSFRLSGPWGHFRRVEGNTVKTTYRIIPRTTVAGLLAAVLGIGRNQYYDLFGPESSAMAIEPVSELRTINLPVNNLTTSQEGLKGVNTRGKVSVYYPDPTEDRQRTNYEVLVEPEYRIDLWLDDEEKYDELREYLSEGKSYYTPSLGLSEYLADIEYLGEYEVTAVAQSEPHAVDSAVPDPDGVIPEPNVNYGTERSPAFMERTTTSGEFSGRRTTSYLTYTYSPDGDSLTVSDTTVASVDNRTVVFR
nr:type I-B CRISPR-associated protein Cas5b [Haloarcula sp. Atlit-7R]